jgi:putative Ca2+/H+ antiporter (TMEM165/GDT1 family)
MGLYMLLICIFVLKVLSTGLGRIVPNLISRKHTNSAATVLYLFFGLRLLYIAWKSDPKGSQKKEMEEVCHLFMYHLPVIVHSATPLFIC